MPLDDICFGSGQLVSNVVGEIPTGLLYAPLDITFGLSGYASIYELRLYREKVAITIN